MGYWSWLFKNIFIGIIIILNDIIKYGKKLLTFKTFKKILKDWAFQTFIGIIISFGYLLYILQLVIDRHNYRFDTGIWYELPWYASTPYFFAIAIILFFLAFSLPISYKIYQERI